MPINASAMSDAVVEFDLEICRFCNRACQQSVIRKLFAMISRLGDGIFWYLLMLMIPLLFGAAAIDTSVRMAVAGAGGLLVYKLIKSSTARLRPYMVDSQIRLGASPLDRYSFPSGHTLHASAFSITAAWSIPELCWLVLPFAFLVALSRIVLGLHYPSDVLAGAGIGGGLAILVLSV